ncbi:hypothetical protein EDC54_11471 [Samsonia erythrinae]|uniref:Uncharacterized protein n=1 Tax=Samsonia erythrinae TaxID=160434 RepID=A0A4V6P2V8_9GAMM|nr:hypothetical protein EDC54_11471 [Samsonia erythrinae]
MADWRALESHRWYSLTKVRYTQHSYAVHCRIFESPFLKRYLRYSIRQDKRARYFEARAGGLSEYR